MIILKVELIMKFELIMLLKIIFTWLIMLRETLQNRD